jgi:signal peptidase
MAAISARPIPAAPSFGWSRARRLAFDAAGWLLLGLGALAIALATLGPTVFGWQFAVVGSGSMEPAIHTGSVAVFGDVPAEGVYRGDIVMYHLPDGTRVTHRVASVTADGASLITKGDANRVADAEPVSVGAVEGKFLFSIPYLGYISGWVREPIGFAAVMLIPGLIVISLSLASIFRARANHGGPPASNRGVGDRIVRYPQPGGEDETVRFPIRRHHEAPEQPSEGREPVPFAAAAPVPRAAEILAAPVASVVEAPAPPLASVEPPAPRAVPPAPPALAALPGPGPQIPLRGQSTSTDARAERLVRVIRSEVEELRETLDQLANDRADFLEADLAAIIADSHGAASLPAPVLVRALLMANERNEEL